MDFIHLSHQNHCGRLYFINVVDINIGYSVTVLRFKMTGGHDAQPYQIREAIGNKVKVRQKLSDCDLDCGDNVQIKKFFEDYSHFSWNRSSVRESTNAVLEKTQKSMYKVVCASSSSQTFSRTKRPRRQSEKESSSSEDDDDETDNDVETPMCLEKSVETPMCLEKSVEKDTRLEKADNNFPFSCALSDIKQRSAFKDFEWSSDEDCSVKYTLPTKLKTFGKTARKSMSTANSKSEVIFRGSQETSPNKINPRRPSVKTKLKISRGEMLTNSILQSCHKGSSYKSPPHKETVGKLLITRDENNRYKAVPPVSQNSSSKKLKKENRKFSIENFIK